MLEIKNAKKYFNHGKRNQVRAIDDISLTLPAAGLVALLGPSGCGKTTTLNVIGGLDKLKKGKILLDDKRINSRLSYKRDKIRNLKIGYIFQDYKLIDDMSVYENVAIVLKMIGIKDKSEIKKRVEYTLEKTGMLRYKKRPASMLSGGERQRVAIARAIVKDPEIILADEPTGNLDSKNSLEIMKIIKAISKNKLVVLVTHEKELAKFYASKIIELQDGKVVKEYNNEFSGDLDYKLDNTFHLKDFENINKLKADNVNINVYSNDKENIKLDIVIDNNNIYIKSATDNKISAVDASSNIDFIDDHYKKINKNEIDKYEFDFDDIINKNIKKRYSSILNPITLIIGGFKKVISYSFLKKLLLAGFFLSGMFLMYAVSSMFGILNIKDEDFIEYNKNYLIIKEKKNDINKFLELENREEISYVLPGDSKVNFSLKLNNYYQTSNVSSSVSGSLSSINMISSEDLIYGKMVENDYEIIVDKMILDRMLNSSDSPKMAGLFEMESFINQKLSLNNMNEFVIVGISDISSPSIYVNNSMFLNIIDNSNNDYYEADLGNTSVLDYNLYLDKINITKGRLPYNDYEVILNSNQEGTYELNKETDIKVNDRKLTVVGFYTSANYYEYNLVNINTVKFNLIDTKENIMIYSTDKDKTLNDLRNMKYNIADSYESSKETYKNEMKDTINSRMLVAQIILGISLIEIFLMIRSSFLSRVKEIGILRAIGVKKLDVYKMFFGEIFAVSTLASIPGVLFMTYILKTLSSSSILNFITKEFLVNPFIVLITVIFTYLFNLLIGLLPVWNTLRKTPAAILARHDLD